MVGGLGHAHGLELTNAVLYPEARILTATFDADVDPDSVDASKFYIREAGFATGGIQLAGSTAFASGTVVSLLLTDAHVAAQERIYSKRLAIETGAVASAAGEQFDAAFGIGTAFFAGAVSVQAVDAGSDGLGFSRDGTKMFVGDYNNRIREYALGTAFDVSTARLVGNSPRLDDSTGHFAFSPDGSRLFVSLDGSQIRQYDTAAPFDTSNLTDAGSLSVGSEYSLLYGIALSTDGRNVFVADGDDGQIRQYGLPSPFDLAGASYAAALDLAPQEITPTSFAFGKDGTRMLILDDEDAVFEYALPNAFNLTGAVYGGTFIDLGSAENDNTANALGLAFDNDGRKMFVVNNPDHFAVSEYVLGMFGMEVLDETASTIRATANPDAAFVTIWQTTSANEEIMIPTGGTGGSYTVTWGDASISTHVVGDQTHVYKEPGTYLVSIYGDFTRIYLPYHPENSLKLLSIEQWGDIRWESMRGAFNGATNMVYRATDAPNLSAVTDTSEMFRFALRFNGNLSNWDVSSVTDMSDMFSIAGAFNGDISTWNVSSVTDMSNMFLATNSFDQNLGNWYVVLHDTSMSGANEALAISAQNEYLDSQNPTYAVDDPRFVVTGGALAIKPGLSVPPGSYEVNVTSTGGFGQGNSKTVEISVDIAQTNSPPSVDAGEPVAVSEGAQVTLNATASDPDGDQITYSWRHDSSLEIILTDADSLAPSFTAPQVRGNTTITFTLTADDGRENGTDTVQVTVLDEPANSPPSVDAGEPVAVSEGAQVTLNATASDQDGDQLTYSWRHDSSLEMILTGADSLAPSFTAPQVRGNTTITFTLTADDGMENGTDTVQVTVLDEPANSPPSVDAGEPVAVSEGAQVTLNATASDQDGDQLTYSWNHDSALGISLANAASLSPTFTAPQVSANTTVAFTLTADDGTDTRSDTVTVTILDVPVVGTPNGGSGQNTTAVLNPDGPLGPRDIGRITLTSDTPGAIEAIWVTPSETPAGYRISWAQVGDPYLTWTDSTGNAFPTDPSRTITGLEEGIEYKAKVRATYGGTSGDWSGEITITVARSANNPPTADAGTAQTVQEGDTVTLSATASDQDGDQLTYSWSHDSSLEMILTDADSLAPSFTAPQVHGNTTITFTLMADDGTDTHSNTVTVTILDVPVVGTLNDRSNQNTRVVLNPDGPLGPRDIGRITLTSDTPGVIEASWVTPSETPAGYRISWAQAGDPYLTWTDSTGNAFPTDPSRTITGLEEGTEYKAKMRATYGGTSGDWSGDATITVTNTPATGPPVVQAGGDQTVEEGDTVTLSGSATDPDGDSITYTWSQTGPAAPRITFANASEPSTTFTAPPVTGDTTFTLMLTADDGTQPATDTLNVTVNETGAAFVTTWTASNSDRSITLPMEGTYSILWGDGSNSTDVSGSQSHTYGAAGNYTVTVLGDGLEHIYMYGDAANARQLMSIEQWGGTKWTTMYGAFGSAANMVYRATDTPDLSGVTDMTYMFTNAASFDGDLSAWDVSGVTDMFAMFHDATSFNGDLSTWDVSGVTNMIDMFHGATSFNGDLSTWDVSKVTYMNSMFFEAHSFNGDLSAWDVSEVTDMFAMFHDAISFNGYLSAWDVSKVTGMGGMFHGATSFNGDLSAWDVSKVTGMGTMFHEASSFNGDLSAWDVSEVTDMNAMFDRATSFNGNLSAWDVSEVTDMNAMFFRATSFNGDLSTWDVSKVTKMIYMFRGATSFNGDLSAWDVSKVTGMGGMFHGATSFNGDLSAWDVSE